MRNLLERLESSQKVQDWCRLNFPGGVRAKFEQVYPEGTDIVSKEHIAEAKKLQRSWLAYSKKLDRKLSNVLQSWAENHQELAEKVDKAFDKVVRGGDKGDWVSLNAALARAEESLYY